MQTYFRFDSLTNANLAKRLLGRSGIASAIRRDPNPDRHRGCGFALYVHNHYEQAQSLLQAHGLLPHEAREG